MPSPDMAERLWVCSVKDLDWRAHGLESAKFECLLLNNGYFYDGQCAAVEQL